MEIPIYISGGDWGKITHPLADGFDGDYETLMSNAGYGRLTQLDPGRDERSISLTVWTRDRVGRPPAAKGSPRYLVDIEFHPAGTVDTVAAGDVVDLMDVLARWAPVVQTALLCDEAAEKREREQR